jgi:hypothetical protein
MNLNLKSTKKNIKGAVTIEACIALPVFLGFFLMLLCVIKIACINITLDHAVNETAKQVSAYAYPVSFLNEYEDKLIEEYGEEKINSFQEIAKAIPYNSIKVSGIDFSADLFSGNFNSILNFGEDLYWSLKQTGKYEIVKAIMNQFIDNSFINKTNLKLSLIEFPQGLKEYEACKNSTSIKKLGLIPEKDFGRDDVVIQVQYFYKIAIPLLGSKTINFMHTAVERAWVHGGNGVYTSKEEGIKLEDFTKTSQVVYITRTGDKYHKEGCRYLRLSKIPVELNDDLKSRYEPCKICKP